MSIVIGELCEASQIVSPRTICAEVLEQFRADPGLDCLPVILNGAVLGIVHRTDFLLNYASPFRADLYARRSITRMMNPKPLVVEEDWPLDSVAALLIERPSVEFQKPFIVARKDVYLGVATPVELLRRSLIVQKERTSDLVQARERAEQESRSKTHFLASTSHELRTPLNAIIGFADAMVSEVFGRIEPDKYAGYANDILMSGRHLLNLINDILDVSRIEGGHLTLHETIFSLAVSVWEVERLMHGLAEDSGLTFVVDVPASLPPVVADEQRIRQVIINLLSNAIKFTPAGGTVSVRAALTDDGILVSVRDTGIGMTREDAERVIRPFEQVETWNNRTRGGTGLGLAIVKGMVEAHGGAMNIKTAPGEGTDVSFTLPRRRIQPSGLSLGVAGGPWLQESA